MDKVWLKIYIQESKLGNVKIGQKAEIKIDSHPDRVFSGEITFISQEAEFTPKNIQTKEERVKLVYEVKIEIDNLEGILKPGMPADATLIE
jgi:HlyD family secretion protein